MAGQAKELDGKVAVVTGAGRNIGRQIAIDLAADGAAVIVNARTNQAEADGVVAAIEQAGGKAAVCLGDVSDPQTSERLARMARERFGGLDILVNNAALRRERKFDEMSFDEWREITGTILNGAFLVTKACIPQLKASGDGSIINIGGMSGHVGARERAHVITAKMGLVGFTRALAHEYAADGVTVNCVVPGMIDTPAGKVKTAGGPQHYQFAKAVVGGGRKGTIEELAGLVRFLCGPRARYITGQDLHVNGGAYMG